MRKRIRKRIRKAGTLWTAVMIGILLLGKSSMHAWAADELEIEQVQANMPQVTAYVRSQSELEMSDLDVWLGKEKLTPDAVRTFGETGQATDYFVLVDVSNSMPDAYCTSVKNALVNFSEGLKVDDKIVLMAFGEEVTVLLTGSEEKTERIQAIELLHNQDTKTLLFEAIQKTADMADKMQDEARKIVLVISDGENFAAGESTGEEAKSALGDRNMPVYAMGISDTARENLNQFGEIARTLGGTLRVFTPEEADVALQELQKTWEQTWVLTFQAGSNRVDNSKNTFTLKQLSTGVSRTRDVMVGKYQSDQDAPEITAVEKTGDRQLTVTFSETVMGSENSAAWNIAYGDSILPVVTATAEGNQTVLTFADVLYGGTYAVSAPGVTDNSMEQNKAAGTFEVEIEGPEPEKEEEVPIWQAWLQTWWWVILLVVLAMVLLVILLIWRKIKRSRGIVYVNGKVSLMDKVEERQHISIEREGGIPVTLELLGQVKGKNQIALKLYGSMIIGRASLCDLSLDDPQMSRQHFALEYHDGNMFITDLQTTNGTKVNGVSIRKDHRLSPGDVISVGSIQMRIHW